MLYLISPPALEPEAFAVSLEEALCAVPVAAFQLRLKGADEDAVRRAVRTLMPLCHAHDTAFILNDTPALAAALDCDGAHIGREDGDIAAARALLKDKMLGVSCYNSRHLAMEAAEAGADYVAFGSFYPTTTKEAATPADISTLEAWSFASEVPAVAIGGITPGNAAPLLEAGAAFVAVCSAVWHDARGPGAAARDFHALFRLCNANKAG